jgi:hypothetical protein
MMHGGRNITHVRTENGPCPSALTGQLVQGQPLFLIQERPVPKVLHLDREEVQKSCNGRPKVVEIKSKKFKITAWLVAGIYLSPSSSDILYLPVGSWKLSIKP